MTHIVVLGGGFGGLEAATQLRKNLSSEHTITLIDKKDLFYLGPVKLWVIAGERTEASCYTDLNILQKKGIAFVKDEVTKIDPQLHAVETTRNKFSYNYLIMAMGAEVSPRLIKGSEHAFNLYDITQGEAINRELQKIEKGTITIVIAKPPYKAGGAPYEAAFLIDALLNKLNKREKITIRLFTPQPRPMPILGKPMAEKMEYLLKDKNVEFRPNAKLIEIKEKSLLFDSGEFSSDLTLLVPPHSLPPVIKTSGLIEGDWIEVDKEYLTTKFDKVYAVGDCTGVKLANGMSLAKAGVIAEAEAQVVAHNIISELNGSPKIKFNGKVQLILELGFAKATGLNVDFFAEPNPVPSIIAELSEEYKRKKIDFEKERLARWFQ